MHHGKKIGVRVHVHKNEPFLLFHMLWPQPHISFFSKSIEPIKKFPHNGRHLLTLSAVAQHMQHPPANRR